MIELFRSISEISTKASSLEKLSEEALPKHEVCHHKMKCPMGGVKGMRRDRIAVHQAAP
jgi:hypothetical protein